jgi:ribonuclease BN (tRNA processing enzyme)
MHSLQATITAMVFALVPVGATAQQDATAPAGEAAGDGDVELVTLGTIAGPQPHPERAQTSNLLIVNDTQYLIDAGDGVSRRLAEADADFTDIGRIFITHNHNDHTAGLANLLNVAWAYGRREPIEIYGPPGTEEMVKGALAFNAVDESIRMAQGERGSPLAPLIQATNVDEGEIYSDDNIRVTAVENTHFAFPGGSGPESAHRSYTYRFDMGETSIVITGDTGPSDAIENLAQGADVLVSEAVSVDEIRERRIRAGTWDRLTPSEQEAWYVHMNEEHITPAEAGAMAERAGVTTLILTHLSSSGQRNDDYQRFADAAAKGFSGEIIVAEDLMRIEP